MRGHFRDEPLQRISSFDLVDLLVGVVPDKLVDAHVATADSDSDLVSLLDLDEDALGAKLIDPLTLPYKHDLESLMLLGVSLVNIISQNTINNAVAPTDIDVLQLMDLEGLGLSEFFQLVRFVLFFKQVLNLVLELADYLNIELFHHLNLRLQLFDLLIGILVMCSQVVQVTVELLYLAVFHADCILIHPHPFHALILLVLKTILIHLNHLTHFVFVLLTRLTV